MCKSFVKDFVHELVFVNVEFFDYVFDFEMINFFKELFHDCFILFRSSFDNLFFEFFRLGMKISTLELKFLSKLRLKFLELLLVLAVELELHLVQLHIGVV